jgi:hypothetical protein
MPFREHIRGKARNFGFFIRADWTTPKSEAWNYHTLEPVDCYPLPSDGGTKGHNSWGYSGQSGMFSMAGSDERHDTST